MYTEKGEVIWTESEIYEQDYLQRIARAVLNKNNMRISTKLIPQELSGLLIASITDADTEGGREVVYYFMKRFSGFPEQLEEQLYRAMVFKQTELELIARGDVL
jgi:hypothetical protein